MESLGPTDALPGNLSDQQLFVLALLAIKADEDIAADGEESAGISRHGGGHDNPGRYYYRTLSWKVAEEFDGEDSRRTEERERRTATGSGYRFSVLTTEHTSSLSRTIKRLEQRGYVERDSRRWRPTKHVTPTETGIRAGREALRRHRDGRYNLSFETIEDEVEDGG